MKSYFPRRLRQKQSNSVKGSVSHKRTTALPLQFFLMSTSCNSSWTKYNGYFLEVIHLWDLVRLSGSYWFCCNDQAECILKKGEMRQRAEIPHLPCVWGRPLGKHHTLPWLSHFWMRLQAILWSYRNGTSVWNLGRFYLQLNYRTFWIRFD